MRPKQQQIEVMGVRMDLYADVAGGKFYHGSPKKLRKGTLLRPGAGARFKESAEDQISITSDPDRALFWVCEGGDVDGYVYEVMPIGPVDPWRVGLAEYGTRYVMWEGRVASAKIVRLVSGFSCPRRITNSKNDYMNNPKSLKNKLLR